MCRGYFKQNFSSDVKISTEISMKLQFKRIKYLFSWQQIGNNLVGVAIETYQRPKKNNYYYTVA